MKTERRRLLAGAAILAAGAVLRLHGLGNESFWNDEGWTWGLIRGTPSELLRGLIEHDGHPPLYFLLLQGWSKISGVSEAALRLPSALAGILSLPLMYLLGRRLAGETAGILSMLLLALNPMHVAFSREARSYALLFLLCLVSLHLLLDLRDAPGRGRRLALAAVTAAILATHYMGAFFIAAEACLAVFLRKDRPGFLRDSALGFAGAAAFFLPWLPMFARHMLRVGNEFWLPFPTWEGVLSSAGELAVYPCGMNGKTVILLTVLFFAPAAAAPVLTRRREHAALLLLLFLPAAGELLASFSRPVFYTRTLLYVLIPLLALDAILLSRLPRAALAAGAVLLAAAQVPGLVRVHAIPEKEDWRGVADLLARGVGPDDRVVIQPGYLCVNLEYYASLRADSGRWAPQLRVPEENGFDREWLPREAVRREALGAAGGVWLVTRHGGDGGWPDALKEAFEQRTLFRGRGAEARYYARRGF